MNTMVFGHYAFCISLFRIIVTPHPAVQPLKQSLTQIEWSGAAIYSAITQYATRRLQRRMAMS